MGVWHRSKWGQAGSSIGELALVVAIVGILTALATPLFLTYYQASKLRVAAEEIASFINQGRQLAIKQNGNVCVHITATAVHYHLGNCANPVWIPPGVGTDSAGNLKAPDGVTLTPAATTIFTYLGAPTAGATYTVTNPQNASTLRVVVATSGRVCIAPNPPSCP